MIQKVNLKPSFGYEEAPNNFEKTVSVKSILEEVLANFPNENANANDANVMRQNSRIEDTHRSISLSAFNTVRSCVP